MRMTKLSSKECDDLQGVINNFQSYIDRATTASEYGARAKKQQMKVEKMLEINKLIKDPVNNITRGQEKEYYGVG